MGIDIFIQIKIMDKLDNVKFYQMSLQLWNECWKDTDLMMRDLRGREMVKQLIRSVGSISANIEEGYGRGNQREYPHFLKIPRGSARESRGWYIKSKFLLDEKLIEKRSQILNEISAMLTKSIETLENKLKK